MNSATLYRLLAWLSPAYPIGGFSYSHGIEWAVEDGLIRDRATLAGWIGTILIQGAGRIDGALFAAAWRAAKANDDAALDDIAIIAAAWRGTTETALESAAQGSAFASTTIKAWPDARLAALAARHDKLALPVAAGVAFAPHAELADALMGYLSGFAANLVSAGVRLIPLGQTDGQLTLADLESAVVAAAEAALAADLDQIGSAAPMLDWTSMRHETQYTRLFRS
jgi:urease accessory protein